MTAKALNEQSPFIGINRFSSLLKNDFSIINSLILELLNENAADLLKTISIYLSNQDQSKIVQNLDFKNRQKWKALTKSTSLNKITFENDSLIYKKLVSHQLSTNFCKDIELTDLIRKLSIDEVHSIISANLDISKLLFLFLEKNQILKLFSKMSTNEISTLLEKSFKDSDIPTLTLTLKQHLLKKQVTHNPFHGNIEELIPLLTSDKAFQLIKQCTQKIDQDKILSLALRVAPLSAIFQLSSEILEQTLSNLDVDMLVDLCLEIDEQYHQTLKSSIGPKGSPKLAMFNMNYELKLKNYNGNILHIDHSQSAVSKFQKVMLDEVSSNELIQKELTNILKNILYPSERK